MIHRRQAFTLIELLAASALAAVLMLVLFQVLGSVGRTRSMLANSTAEEAWKAGLFDTIRRDFANAAAVRFEPNRVTLTGHGSLDRRSFAPGHDPVTVTYAVERSSLVRHQTPRGEWTDEPGWSEIVCVGVSRMSIEPLGRGAGFGIPRRDLLATPLRVRLEGFRGLVVDEVIVIR